MDARASTVRKKGQTCATFEILFTRLRNARGTAYRGQSVRARAGRPSIRLSVHPFLVRQGGRVA